MCVCIQVPECVCVCVCVCVYHCMCSWVPECMCVVCVWCVCVFETEIRCDVQQSVACAHAVTQVVHVCACYTHTALHNLSVSLHVCTLHTNTHITSQLLCVTARMCYTQYITPTLCHGRTRYSHTHTHTHTQSTLQPLCITACPRYTHTQRL